MNSYTWNQIKLGIARTLMPFFRWFKKQKNKFIFLFKLLSHGVVLSERYRPHLHTVVRIHDYIKLKYIAAKTTLISGPKKIFYKPNEAIVLCLLKDAETWIDDFIQHYQKMGFKHIVFLDNGSKDNTLNIAKKYNNITILQTTVTFKNNDILFRRYLIQSYAKKRWSLTVDVDELWDYLYSDKVGLSDLLNYLKAQGSNAVVSQILDMFMPTLPSEKQPLKTYNLYDISGITKERLTAKHAFGACGFSTKKELSDTIFFHRGGVRAQIFGLKGIWLTKMPLLFYDETIQALSHQHFSNNATIADISSVLLHYKLTSQFKDQVQSALEHKQYAYNSADYRKYALALKEDHSLQLIRSTVRTLNSVNQLIDEGFLIVSAAYRSFITTITRQD